MLELKEIKKKYWIGNNSQEVLKGISIKFRKNEFVSILGQSGSGKTTLLNIVGGLDKYSSGDLIIDGTSTKNYQDRDWDVYRNYRVGFIFQSYNLIMHQSVYSNVEIALTLSGVSKSERKRRVIEALEKVGLKEHINKKPNQLSGGQMQRVAIARALVNNPEIILADEPTGALDSSTSIQIMDLLKEIAKDRLVIMVTHNPEIAKHYSTRIIELKDGQIINDSNPFDGDEEPVERETKKTSMSLLTSLSLSFNNLLTKKGRTFLTAFAGSIGIIGIALILSLANGVSKYVSNIEKESLQDYPIKIERTSVDIFGAISQVMEEASQESKKVDDGKLHSDDDIVSGKKSIEQGIVKKNNIVELKKYVDNSQKIKDNADYISYEYDLQLQVYSSNYDKVNPNEYASSDDAKDLFKELDGRESSLNNKYKILAGRLPENENEIVFIVGNSNKISDSVLYALEIKDRKNIKDDLSKYSIDSKYKVQSNTYEYTDFLDKTYKLILNTDFYKEENGIFISYENNSEYMKEKIDNGMELKIVGVLKDDNSLNSYVGYKHDLTLKIINEISKTTIYKKQIENKNINVLTGVEFNRITDSFEENSSKLGIYDIQDPSRISIYPKNYEAKQEIVKAIDEYNKQKKDNGENDLVVSYEDLMKTMVNTITGVVKIITFVLIGLVAISLIVSSIMIAIITYISVLERTKEIGILRAIGASKKDVKRVFRAETIIEGLIAGVLGIVIALIISIPINIIVGATAKINNIASLPILSAFLLVLLSVALNVIAGSKPSGMAAKKNPVEALRNE